MKLHQFLRWNQVTQKSTQVLIWRKAKKGRVKRKMKTKTKSAKRRELAFVIERYQTLAVMTSK